MKFVAFDIETTGLVPGLDKIIELAFVKFDQGEPVAVFSTLVDPQTPIPEAATRVNGIRNEDVKGKPSIEDLLDPLTQFCGDLPLVAHNATFDMSFLVQDYTQLQVPTPKGPVLDTLLLSRKVIPGLPNYRLSTLVHHFEISAQEFHRAQEDAISCGQVFLCLLSRMGLRQRESYEIDLLGLKQITGLEWLYFPEIERQPRQGLLF